MGVVVVILLTNSISVDCSIASVVLDMLVFVVVAHLVHVVVAEVSKVAVMK